MPSENNEPKKIVPNFEDIKIQSQDDEVQELLGHPPSWMLRFGITVIFLIVLGLLLLSTVIKYPDVVEAEIVLTSNNPPITLFSKTNGKIDQLLVTDQQKVKKGDLLMILESEANYEEIIEAEQALQRLKDLGEDNQALRRFKLPEELNLGPVNNSFSSLLGTLKALQFFLKDNAVYKKMELYQGEIQFTGELNQSIQKQIKNYELEIALEEKNFKRNKKLEEEGLVSSVEFEVIEKNFIQAKRNYEQLKMAIINNQITSEQLSSKILDLQSNRRADFSDYWLTLKEKMSTAEKELMEWKNNYLFYSTHDGNVSLIGFRANKEFVSQLDPVMTIIPEDKTDTTLKEIIARAKVDQFASGKIEIGDQVSIHLESFPAKEFGVIKSSIESISLLPSVDEEGKRHYSMDIPLEHPMTTTYNNNIPFRPNQSGLAKIITKDRSLAGRVFEQFIDLIKNS